MRRINIILSATVILFVLCSRCGRKQTEATGFLVDTIASPAGANSAEPYLFTDPNGDVYLSWVQKTSSGHRLLFSRLENKQWTRSSTITADSNWFVNWADYPMMVSHGNGGMLAHVLSRNGSSTYAYDVKMTTSVDRGGQWGEPFILNEDGKEGEHGFVSMVPYGENYLVAWLDGRNTVVEGVEQHEGHHGAMSLRAAILTQTGAKVEEWELDNRTCDCCQTTAVITPNGPAIVYRDRSSEEVRDMSIVRYVNGSWTQPSAIHTDGWKIAGCPVNGPRADVWGNTMAVAWFTAPDEQAAVNVAFSDNSGASFREPVLVSEDGSIGRVDLVMVAEDEAWVTWMDGPEIRLRSVKRNGTMSSLITIGTSSASRSSGFPQMTAVGDGAIVAWTDDDHKTIRTVRVSFL